MQTGRVKSARKGSDYGTEMIMKQKVEKGLNHPGRAVYKPSGVNKSQVVVNKPLV